MTPGVLTLIFMGIVIGVQALIWVLYRAYHWHKNTSQRNADDAMFGVCITLFMGIVWIALLLLL